jgi:hypothetical protein
MEAAKAAKEPFGFFFFAIFAASFAPFAVKLF